MARIMVERGQLHADQLLEQEQREQRLPRQMALCVDLIDPFVMIQLADVKIGSTQGNKTSSVNPGMNSEVRDEDVVGGHMTSPLTRFFCPSARWELVVDRHGSAFWLCWASRTAFAFQHGVGKQAKGT